MVASRLQTTMLSGSLMSKGLEFDNLMFLNPIVKKILLQSVAPNESSKHICG